MGVEEGDFEPEAVVGAGAAEDGAAFVDEGAADGGDGFVVCSGGAEEDGGDGGAVVELQVGVGFDEVGEFLGECAGVVDECGESGAAEGAEGDGHFEYVGASGGAEGAAEEVGVACFGVVVGVEVVGLVVEGVEGGGSGYGEEPGGDGLPAEFVEVEGDGVGAFDAVELVSVGFAEEEGAAVCGVDVEFGAVAVAEVGDFGEGVDESCVGGACGGGDEDGSAAGAESGGVSDGEGFVEGGEVDGSGGCGDGEGWGRPRSQAARGSEWWALAPQMMRRAPCRSRARSSASWLDSVPPVVMRASPVG